MEALAKIPQHVTFIMDGNGRWAQQRGLERSRGHVEGVESVRAILEASLEWGIKYVSFFAFSEENWGRPEAEVNTLMSLMFRAMLDELDTLKRYGVHFVVLGNRSRLDEALNEMIDRVDAETADGKAMTMIVFVSYSGKWDIEQASRRMASEGGESIEPYLSTSGIPDPDLLVRTSGEKRISNFMLWQTAYTEFVFVDTLWPDFRKVEYRLALEEYASRDRRFGKVK
ncbi:MAG: polyprenyl diphosphate synthase [Candidatus Cryptobacteroides sp.]